MDERIGEREERCGGVTVISPFSDRSHCRLRSLKSKSPVRVRRQGHLRRDRHEEDSRDLLPQYN